MKTSLIVSRGQSPKRDKLVHLTIFSLLNDSLFDSDSLLQYT